MFSLRRVDREQMARSGRRSDSLVVRMLALPRRLITTVLIGNEVVNVSISAVLASMAPLLYPGRSEFELALLATMTALPILLLLGEITPKTIALQKSPTWSRAVIRPLWLFTIVVTPVRWVVQSVANLVLVPLGGSSNKKSTEDLSEQEFKNLVDAGSAEGQLAAHERSLIHRVFEFGDKTVDQVMEPRDKIFALPHDTPLIRLMSKIAKRGYSRVPIYRGSIDNILGVVHAKDLVIQTVKGPLGSLRELMRDPLIVPRTMRCEHLFNMFKQRRIHMAFVGEGDGRLVGMITMEDLLEELFGEIRDEREREKAMPLRLDSHISGRYDVPGIHPDDPEQPAPLNDPSPDDMQAREPLEPADANPPLAEETT